MDLDSSHSETPLMTIQKGENTIAVKTRQTYTLQTDIQKSTECLENFFLGLYVLIDCQLNGMEIDTPTQSN